MKYYQRALILCSLFTFTLQPAALLADDTSAKKPEEQFMEMLSQMMNSAGAGPGQQKAINLKTPVAGLKMAHLHEITLAFEFLVLTLTVPGLRARNFKILRAFAYLRHFHSP